ncbi:DNA polymerase Y family protein [Beduini massiliensis]|uniref:DNA polymerase Y family protein n=1 Tax=Beduini massiliensis TaxID=1585974 RepID=UPI001FA6CAB1|nr:DNA polymerase IV [Beduini massiliensis]
MNADQILGYGNSEVIKMWERAILHADINHCYAQIEEMRDALLAQIPMAVGGHEEFRHGIILAKNDLAKKYRIKTGESLREAYKKCPHLKIIHPDYDLYLAISEQVKEIYRRYSDKVESFGLDEAWIDVTHSQTLFGNPIEIARKIRMEVYHELGLTISIGISFNKVFAKMASDMDKHHGITVITSENYRERLWGLPIEAMFYVGQATAIKLRARGIGTIGQLANTPRIYLKSFLGKPGEWIWEFANGFDESEVAESEQLPMIKSVGNSITAIHDLETAEELKMVFRVLSESVAARLRQLDKKGSVVSIYLRTNGFDRCSRQIKSDYLIDTSDAIMECVERLLKAYLPLKGDGTFGTAYRSIGLAVSKLQKDAHKIQLSLFENENRTMHNRDLEVAIEKIREKYGSDKIKRCIMMKDKELTGFDPKKDHVIHPMGFFGYSDRSPKSG